MAFSDNELDRTPSFTFVTPALCRGPTLHNGICPLLHVGCRNESGMTVGSTEPLYLASKPALQLDPFTTGINS